NVEQPTSLAALGPAPTRQALEEARVGELFLTRDYVAHHGSDAEEVVHAAFDQSALVEELSDGAADRLDAFGGVAARLRYQQPRAERTVTPDDAVGPATAHHQ